MMVPSIQHRAVISVFHSRVETLQGNLSDHPRVGRNRFLPRRCKRGRTLSQSLLTEWNPIESFVFGTVCFVEMGTYQTCVWIALQLLLCLGTLPLLASFRGVDVPAAATSDATAGAVWIEREEIHFQGHKIDSHQPMFQILWEKDVNMETLCVNVPRVGEMPTLVHLCR